jgi:nucleoside-diphosphate-sugar epimerase
MNILNICVTGASGFIGRKLVHALCQQGHNVTILSRRSKINDSFTNITVVNGDLTSTACPLDLFLNECDVIINCAGEISNPDKMTALHVGGTQRLIKAVIKKADQRGKPIHWIQLSSVGVYGPIQGKANRERVVAEESPVNPIGVYESTKSMADQLVIQAAKNPLLTYTIIRPSNVFGQGMPSGTLRALAKIVDKGLFFYIGYSKTISTYVHVDDVVALLLLCLSNPNSKGEIFNISNDCLLEEMIEGISSTLNVSPPWLRLPENLIRAVAWLTSPIVKLPLSQEVINVLVARTQYPTLKLKNKLNFQPQVSVPRGMSEIVLKNE